MIIRREHNGNFTIVPNAVYDDPQLSIEAIGLLGYLLSRPPNWRIRHAHLQKKWRRLGRGKLERMIRELIAVGYIERDEEQPRDSDNRFATYNYVVRDVPAAEPLSGFPLRRYRCRKVDNGNKKERIITDTNKTSSKPPPPAQAVLSLSADEGLTEFGRAARDAEQIFVFEGSTPFAAWLEFRGPDGMPLADVAVVGGAKRRGYWMPALYPPSWRKGASGTSS